MKEFNVHLNNGMAALMVIVILAVGSISITGTTHVVMADQNGKVCVLLACDGTLNLGSGSNDGGNSNDGSTKGTLTVKKVVVCDDPERCGDIFPADFSITVTGTNPQPPTFQGSETGTKVTLDPGDYSVSEPTLSPSFIATMSPDCSGIMHAGDTKSCTVTNTLRLD